MPAYKEKDRNTWTVKFQYKNWEGTKKWVTKRGFATKREAVQFGRDFISRQSGSLDMTFAAFVMVYRETEVLALKRVPWQQKTTLLILSCCPISTRRACAASPPKIL